MLYSAFFKKMKFEALVGSLYTILKEITFDLVHYIQWFTKFFILKKWKKKFQTNQAKSALICVDETFLVGKMNLSTTLSSATSYYNFQCFITFLIRLKFHHSWCITRSLAYLIAELMQIGTVSIFNSLNNYIKMNFTATLFE